MIRESQNQLKRKLNTLAQRWRLFTLNRKVAAHSRPAADKQPVVVFNASSRLSGLSQNAAFTMLSVWGLQLSGVPVVYFSCRVGMSRCVLGTNPDDYSVTPPCQSCIAQTKRMHASAPVVWFDYHENERIARELEGLSVSDLMHYVYHCDEQASVLKGMEIPLGALAVPSLRWALRRHHLIDDDSTRLLLKSYILSAFNVAESFGRLLGDINPQAVLLFNGLQYPEAVARWVAQKLGVRVITHEVSFMPFSAFFTEGEATAYPISIPDNFELNDNQNRRLDEYLSHRFQGDFTMAGIRFFREVKGLDDSFIEKAQRFRQVVPVFTNVIFDTSQVHANKVFSDMFAWLDLIVDVIAQHPETLFVIRAHPDEKRPGSRKKSREPVSEWLEQRGVTQWDNVVFIDSLEYVNSYELIDIAKFVLVYNSSIGLEATLLRKPVLCGGKARYTQYPTVFFPQTEREFLQILEAFLDAESIDVPGEFVRNARRFLYYQLYKVSIPFSDFLENHPTQGYVQLKRFSWKDLLPDKSPAIRVVVDGILNQKPFEMPDDWFEER